MGDALSIQAAYLCLNFAPMIIADLVTVARKLFLPKYAASE